MRIPQNEIKTRERVGHVGARPVFHIACVGGLHVYAASNPGGDAEILGVGSHRLLAATLAQRHDGVVLDELSKADPTCFGDLLEGYAEMTAQIRKAQGF